MFPVFLGGLLGYICIFVTGWVMCCMEMYQLLSCNHVHTLFVFDKNFWILCFINWFVVFTCKFRFWVVLETCQFIFYITNVAKCKITLSGLIRIHVLIRDWFNKIFLVNFYHSSVYFCYLKCCSCVFGKPINSCLCWCSGIAVSLVIFARESDSVISYSVIF